MTLPTATHDNHSKSSQTHIRGLVSPFKRQQQPLCASEPNRSILCTYIGLPEPVGCWLLQPSGRKKTARYCAIAAVHAL